MNDSLNRVTELNPANTISFAELMNSKRIANVLNSKDFKKNFEDIHERVREAFNASHEKITLKGALRKARQDEEDNHEERYIPQKTGTLDRNRDEEWFDRHKGGQRLQYDG
jgi:hypothetical protein